MTINHEPRVVGNESFRSRILPEETIATSMVASVLATGIASGIFSINNPDTDLPVLTIGGEKTEYSDAIREEGVPSLERRLVESQVVIPALHEEKFSVAQMPVSSSFELSEDPEAQKFIGESNLDGYAANIRGLIDSGYTIKEIEITGYASDEAQSLDTPNGGIGISNPENDALALDRANFLKDALRTQLPDVVELDGATVAGQEVVLRSEPVREVELIANNYGFTDIESFIREYNSGNLSLSEEDKAYMNYALDLNRGASITISLERPGSSDSVQEYKEVCVRHDVYFFFEGTIEEPRFTFIPVPLIIPIVRRRRRNDGDDSTDHKTSGVDTDNSPSTDSQSADTESVDGNPSLESGLRRLVGETDQQMQRILDGYRSGLPEGYDQWTERQRDAYQRERRDLYARNERQARHEMARERLNRIVRRLTTAALVAMPFAFMHFNFGYCPDKDDTTHNPFRMDVPEYIGVHFGIPFTDIETGDLVIESEACYSNPQQDGEKRDSDGITDDRDYQYGTDATEPCTVEVVEKTVYRTIDGVTTVENITDN